MPTIRPSLPPSSLPPPGATPLRLTFLCASFPNLSLCCFVASPRVSLCPTQSGQAAATGLAASARARLRALERVTPALRPATHALATRTMSSGRTSAVTSQQPSRQPSFHASRQPSFHVSRQPSYRTSRSGSRMASRSGSCRLSRSGSRQPSMADLEVGLTLINPDHATPPGCAPRS